MKSKNKKTKHLTRVESDGLITPELDEEIRACLAMTDDDIDTSDIPEITDWSKAVRRKDFEKVKK